MTVLQFKPRQKAAAPKPRVDMMTPSRFAKAWMCIAIGLYISPWISWLEILSEHDIGSSEEGSR